MVEVVGHLRFLFHKFTLVVVVPFVSGIPHGQGPLKTVIRFNLESSLKWVIYFFRYYYN